MNAYTEDINEPEQLRTYTKLSNVDKYMVALKL